MQLYGARKVDISIGVVPTDTRSDLPVGAAILGVLPPDHPWLPQVYPSAVVRATRYQSREESVAHMRFVPAQRLDGLPGLDGTSPSLLRDSVRLALSAGAPFVDIVVVRAGELQPWDVDSDVALGVLAPYLSELMETQVCVPDAVRPPGAPDSDPDTQIERLLRVLRGLREAVRDNYQILYLDYPSGAEDLLGSVVNRAGSADVALCRWTGAARPMGAHGWRSAAAAMAGFQARADADLTGGSAGLAVRLSEGRRVRVTRHAELLPGLQRSAPRPMDQLVDLALHPAAGNPGSPDTYAMVRDEPALRHPVGQWSLPALRTVKAIHHRIMFAAEQFVFRPVDSVNAFSLVTALDIVLRPFVEGGALVGPSGEGGPVLTGDTIRNRDAPGLVAEISAQLRPWCQDVKVRVAVDPGQQPSIDINTP